MLTHSPSQKRAQCGDVVAAIAAKDAQAEAAAVARDAHAKVAAKDGPAHASQEDATHCRKPKATRCPELRGAITFKKGKKKVYCIKCKHEVSYVGWGQHCSQHHPEKDPNTVADQCRDSNDANDDSGRKDDGGDQTDDVQPEIADVASTDKEPTRRYGQKHDGSNNGKPAPRERKATENAKNLGGEKRNAPAKAAGAKSIAKRKG